MAQRREGSAAAGTKLGRDVTAQVWPLIVLERAANLASGLNKDGQSPNSALAPVADQSGAVANNCEPEVPLWEVRRFTRSVTINALVATNGPTPGVTETR